MQIIGVLSGKYKCDRVALGVSGLRLLSVVSLDIGVVSNGWYYILYAGGMEILFDMAGWLRYA